MKLINKGQPLYRQICVDILEKINSASYAVGDKLPTENELITTYNVSRITIKSALQTLADDGYIKRVSGVGTFIEKKDLPPNEQSNNKTIGLIISGFSDSYGKGLLMAIENETSKQGYSLIIKITHELQGQEERYLQELVSLDINGIIIVPAQAEFYNSYLLQLVLDDYPIVIVDRRLDGIPALFVGSDNFKAAYDATAYLFQKNKKFLTVVMQEDILNSSKKDRIAGIRKYYEDHGVLLNENLWIKNLKTNYISLSELPSIENDIKIITKMLEAHPQITCFLTLDYHTSELVREAIKRMGKSIPLDYSLISFDSSMSLLSTSHITYIQQDEIKIGNTAVDLLFQQIQKKPVESRIHLIPTKLIERGSVQ